MISSMFNAQPAKGFLIAVTLALGLGCFRASKDDLNVVWVVLDAAGAAHFGAYGNERKTTPHLDAFARDATLFERAYAQASWTLPSAQSYFSGLYPPENLHGRLLPGQSLVGALRAAGLRTVAFSENPYVSPEFGFDDGFDDFHQIFPWEEYERSPSSFPPLESAKTVEQAIQWLDPNDAAPFFLYVHLMPPHAPYTPPPPFAGRFDADYTSPIQGTVETLLTANAGQMRLTPGDVENFRLQYQENLAFADHQVGRLLDALEERGILEHTLVVVSSDHGEAFGEHGFLLHSVSVYEEVIHVPLIIRFPERFGPLPRRWSGIVELRMIAPTICRVLGVEECEQEGVDLLDRLRGAALDSERALAFSMGTRSGKRVNGVVWENFKLAEDASGARVVFDLDRDPDERVDLYAEQPRLGEQLARHLEVENEMRAVTRAPDIHPSTQQRLRALGYAE